MLFHFRDVDPRRLAEAGVRFIEVTAPTSWDHHFLIKDELPKSCAVTDQPVDFERALGGGGDADGVADAGSTDHQAEQQQEKADDVGHEEEQHAAVERTQLMQSGEKIVDLARNCLFFASKTHG